MPWVAALGGRQAYDYDDGCPCAFGGLWPADRPNRLPKEAVGVVVRAHVAAVEAAVTRAAREVLVERSRPVVAVRTRIVEARKVATAGGRKKNMGIGQ